MGYSQRILELKTEKKQIKSALRRRLFPTLGKAALLGAFIGALGSCEAIACAETTNITLAA